MYAIDIAEDLWEQRRGNLTGAAGIAGILSLMSISLSAISSFDYRPFAFVLIVAVVALILNKHGRTRLAARIFVLGLIGFEFILLHLPIPGLHLYLLMPVIVGLSGLLLGREAILTVTQIISILVVGTLAVQKGNLVLAVFDSIVPLGMSLIVAGIFYATHHGLADMVSWALNSQQQSYVRAESFYAQGEQLKAAMLDLQKANSKLEQMNVALNAAKRDLEAASNAKSIFLSNVSHELRTPINTIIGYSHAMLTMPEMYRHVPLPDIYKDDIRLMHDNGQYLLGLINDILDLSKVEAGKLDLELAPTSLSEIFKGVIATSTGLLRGKQIQLRQDVPEQLPLVWADGMRVRQILLNLMSNAIKFTETGSVTLAARVERACVHIAVIDTGIGIPESALATLFDRFEQVKQNGKSHYQGTGLGLDISQKLAQMHGSEITVHSTLGVGSTFAFSLPVATDQQTSTTQANRHQVRSAYTIFERKDDTIDAVTTLLLIDRDNKMRSFVHETLSPHNYLIFNAATEEEALTLASGILPSVILLSMDALDGSQILRGLSEDHEMASIPVLAYSKRAGNRPVDAPQVQEFIRMPVTQEELLETVKRVIKNAVMLSTR